MMSLLLRVLDATINLESKKAKTEEKLDTLSDELFAKPLPEDEFRRALCHESRRSERSRKSFLLMLVRHKSPKVYDGKPALSRIVRPLGGLIRETDTFGWLESNTVLGVIFSELGNADLGAAVGRIEFKIISALPPPLQANQVEAFDISFFSYPPSWKDGGGYVLLDPVLYPYLFILDYIKRTSPLLKRFI